MAWLVTPGQLARRAALYEQLASLIGAGVPLLQSLAQLRRHPPGGGWAEPLRRVQRELEAGATFAEAVRRAGGWANAFEVALLDAGERSGRLEQAFRLLGRYYAERSRLAREWAGALAYPLLLLHAAVFLFPFAQFFLSGDWRAYATATGGVLLPIYALALALLYAGQGRHSERWRLLVERLLNPVPWLGPGRRDLALARLAAALEALLSAGVTVHEAWELAARASGSPQLTHAVAAWKPLLAAGQTPAEALQRSAVFPELFASQYAVGEASGKLDETLDRLHGYYAEEGARKLRALAQWAPRAIYLLVVGLIAWKVIRFWMGYFDQIQRAGGC